MLKKSITAISLAECKIARPRPKLLNLFTLYPALLLTFYLHTSCTMLLKWQLVPSPRSAFRPQVERDLMHKHSSAAAQALVHLRHAGEELLSRPDLLLV